VSVIIVAIPRDMPTKSNHLRQFNIFYFFCRLRRRVLSMASI
jgi:hypothetical protein